MKLTEEKGFTAIELMITIVVAAIFLFAGYQLYIQVTRDSLVADKFTRVSNVAYEQLRKQLTDSAAAAPGGCDAASQKTVTGSQTVSRVGTVSLSSVIDCPYGTTPGNLTDVFHVTVTATYTDNGQTKTVSHAGYGN